MADERDKPFRAARRAALAERAKIQRETAAEIERLLRLARRRIQATLAGQPTDYQRWRLPQLRAEIDRVLAAMASDGAGALERGAELSWRAGQALVEAPIAAAGVTAAVEFGRIDTRQLSAMKSFLTNRIRGISAATVERINEELAMVVIGLRSPGEAIAKLTEIFKGNRARALTIVRTELGRAFSTAAQQRMMQAREKLPGLQKQWRRSGKLHPRLHHDAIDGQVREVDKPFDLANGARIMFPRDPEAPPGETVNCGCESLPFMAHWEIRTPGRRPLTPEELAARDAGPRIGDLLDR